MKRIIYITLIIQLISIAKLSTLDAQIKLSPYVSYGAQSINYQYEDIKSKGKGGIGFGADLLYHISEYMIIGSGVRLNTYSSTMDINELYIEQDKVDIDGDAYVLFANGNNIKEEHQTSAIEIPLFFRYQKWINSDMILYGSTGPVFSFLGTVTSTISSGELTTTGYYPEWNLTIDETPEYGFYTRELEETTPETELKTSVGWLIEVGTEYYISKRLNIALGLYYQPGFSNVSSNDNSSDILPEPGIYAGSLNATDKITLSKAGFRIGVNFDLTPSKRASVKSIR